MNLIGSFLAAVQLASPFADHMVLHRESGRDMEDAKFALSLKQRPGGKARLVRFAEADDVIRNKLPNGDDEFTFTYRDSAAPVRAARVTLRRDAEGAVRHKLSCEMNDGWFLERTMFPVIEMPCEEATSLVLGSNKGGVFHDSSKWPVGRWQGYRHGGDVSLRFDVSAKGGRDNGNPIQVSQTVNGLEPGRYSLSAWVKTLGGAVRGSLKYGTCEGEMGEIAFPSKSEWTKVSAEVSVGAQLRLVIWAPPGAKFLIDS